MPKSLRSLLFVAAALILLAGAASAAQDRRIVVEVVPVAQQAASPTATPGIPAQQGAGTSGETQPEPAVVYAGKKLKLTANVENLSDTAPAKTALVWASSDKAVARVDAQGAVTGVSAGTALITCSAKDDESIFGTLAIEVRQAVTSFKLEKQKTTLLVGAVKDMARERLAFTIKPQDAYDQTVLWSSSDESVATVDAQGVVTAVAPGKAVITARTGDPSFKKAQACTVTVGSAVRSVTASPSSATMDKGKTLKLSAAVLPAGALNPKVTWTSSNEKVAAVSKAGVVTAKGVGKATITCTPADGSKVSSAVEITVVQKVTRVTPNTKRLVLFEDKTSRLYVSVSPADATNKAVSWSSSSPWVASVDKTGLVTAKNAGEAVITAASADGSGKKCTFKVIVEPSNPISLESIGFGRFLPNLLGLTVYNRCKTLSITDFDFDMKLYTYSGSLIDSGSYSLGNPVRIGPHAERTIKRTVFGVGYATKVVITITGVTFSDGTYRWIPTSEQDTWTFRR